MSISFARVSVSANVSVGSSDTVEFRGYEHGQIIVPTGSPITGLAFYATDENGDNPVALYNASNVAVSYTVAAARVYPIPEACRGAHFRLEASGGTGNVTVMMQG